MKIYVAKCASKFYNIFMSRTIQPISVFNYLDYRSYLKDWYEAQRKGSHISLRLFSKKAGFTSPNYLKMVMDGDRNLTDESLDKFILALDLNKQEQEFFSNLVHFNQAKKHEEKDKYYQRILQSRKFHQLKPIEREQYEFYSSWYHPVVRELLTAGNHELSADEIAMRLFPAVTSQQVRKSIELLERMRFIARDKEGHWQQTTPVVTTGAESNALTLLNYHLNILDIAKEILNHIAPEQRDISALTLGLPAEKLPMLKKRLQEFRREILEMAATDSKTEKVVLLTMQMMPVTIDKGDKLL